MLLEQQRNSDQSYTLSTATRSRFFCPERVVFQQDNQKHGLGCMPFLLASHQASNYKLIRIRVSFVFTLNIEFPNVRLALSVGFESLKEEMRF